ncbi:MULTISPECIES: class F sortase [Streptomyces]|uniref:Class F sortase n=1 Tax=Streptomyces noboritoensis TaxID=67337 RepID=A0ABV6TVI7_9ACTN|nr:class F sortase [Streptomyces melanogenes]GGP39094.1 class F sortase [Streptomyces melanogenes]
MSARSAQSLRDAQAARRRNGWLLCIAACVGVWLVRQGTETTEPPQPSRAQAFTTTESFTGAASSAPAPPHARVGEARTGGALAGAALAPSEPVRVRIPAIRVDAPVMRLGLARDGSLEVPPPGRSGSAGWYKDGAAPGADGTAVLAGHVDDARGPAVFYALGALKKGGRIEVARADRRTAVFTVDAVEVYPNDAFPDRRVYGPAGRPELRVITCGGGFSEKSGYRGNVVVFAHLTGTA